MSKESKSFLEQASSVLSELRDAAEGLQRLGADQWVDKFLTDAGLKARDEKPDLKVVPDPPVNGTWWEKCDTFHDRCTKHTAHRGGMGRPSAGGEGSTPDDPEKVHVYKPSQPLYEGGNSGPGFEVRHPSAYYQRGTRDLLGRDSIYPYKEGDNIVIGPECFISGDDRVISYAGRNYYRDTSTDDLKSLSNLVDQLTADIEQAAGYEIRSQVADRWANRLKVMAKILEKWL